VDDVLADGSYLSTLYPSLKDKRRRQNGVRVRVIEYELEGVENPEPLYRLLTNLLDPTQSPAEELAALYPQRWEIEIAFDEFKTHLRGGRVVLRSKTPDLVEQEFYGMLLAHWAVRSLMNEAAQQEDIDPDRLSFTHSIRVIRRKLAALPAISP
jgi:IS4 transposase